MNTKNKPILTLLFSLLITCAVFSSKAIAIERIAFLTDPNQVAPSGVDYVVPYPGPATERQYIQLFGQFNIIYREIYSYTDWVAVKRAAEIGIAGNYESLFLSSGGNFLNAEDSVRFDKRELRFDVFYYKNHDITMSVAYRNKADGTMVLPFAIKKGRHKNLGWQK